MSITIFAEPIQKRYSAPRCSSAYMFVSIMTSILVIVPFFLADSSRGVGIWIKRDMYREQPHCSYKYKVVLFLQGVDKEGHPIELFYSTYPHANNLRSEILRMSSVRSREIVDLNSIDSKIDRLELNILTPLDTGESIYQIQSMIFFQCSLKHRAKLSMESLAYISYDSGIAGRGLTVRGDLMLRQSEPFAIRDDLSILFSDDPLVDIWATMSTTTETDIQNILFQDYAKRTVATDFIDRYSLWTRDFRQHAKLIDDQKTLPAFNLTVTVDIPNQQITYIPTPIEVLKDGWIKYISMLMVIGYLFQKVVHFVLFHQVLETKVFTDYIGTNKPKEDWHLLNGPL
mmetsp:Transcript_13721/g.16824  ORF Transcript_13721/g.16824 Transcript_13721/m.16824 type:complete len:343 (+) Transcript_13721:62-1090(+)